MSQKYFQPVEQSEAEKFFDYYSMFKFFATWHVAHALQCPYCIEAYTRECLEQGSNTAEMTEAVHVAAAIRGAQL